MVVNRDIETVAIVFNMTYNQKIYTKNVQPFRVKTYEHFSKSKDHDAVKIARTLLKNGFWLDAMIDIPLYCSSFPDAQMIYSPYEGYFRRASSRKDVDDGKETINRFIIALNQFYTEAEVEKYLTENVSVYQGVLNEVHKNLPDKNFISVMEKYYGKENLSYTLIPTPLLPTAFAFGPRLKTEQGLQVYNIFAPVIWTTDISEYKFGFDKADAINEISVHEFGHSFVNPLTSANSAIIEKYSYLFDRIKEDMKKQGYDNWWTCVTEHIVRLGEIRIAYALNDSARANRIRNTYVNRRKFIYIPALEEKIMIYEQNRYKYPFLGDYFPELLETFQQIDISETTSKNIFQRLRKYLHL